MEMYINWNLRELNVKIVYYGPALSGKTTNLEQIHKRIDPARRSELVSLKTNEDRTLFFDFMQFELGVIANLSPKIHLYTVPGQSYYEASRRLVLKGADGVVFVADSNEFRVEANVQSWNDLQQNLSSFSEVQSVLPIVIQFNKQDLPQALTPQKMHDEMKLNGVPFFAASAISGTGVLDTLKAIVQDTVNRIQLTLH
jgi:signal recognition particle receptor subunit beta